MQLNSPFLDDLSKLAASAAGSLMDMKREIEAAVATKLDNLLLKHNFVPKEEFEAVRLMAVKAREENEELKKRLVQVEELVGKLTNK